MGTRTGERQTERSRASLKEAFERLLRSKGYGAISVGEIADSGNVGRSTFYRHFKSKADVLVALHEDMFAKLFLADNCEQQWLSTDAPESLRSFLYRHSASGGPMVSLSADVRGDTDYIMMQVTGLLTSYVEKGLRQAFSDREPLIPLPVLACSIAGTYLMVLMSWKHTMRDINDEDMAQHIHRTTRAAVVEAFPLA